MAKDPLREEYLKVVFTFSSDATREVIRDTWTKLDGGKSGRKDYNDIVQSYLDDNFTDAVITQTSLRVRRLNPKRYFIYQKTTFTGVAKKGIVDRGISTIKIAKDTRLGEIKTLFRDRLRIAPVSCTKGNFHIHKSTGQVDEA